MRLIQKYKDHSYYAVDGKEIVKALGLNTDKHLFVAISVDIITGEGCLLVSNEDTK